MKVLYCVRQPRGQLSQLAFNEHQPRTGRIMPQPHSRRELRLLRLCFQYAAVAEHLNLPSSLSNLTNCHSPRPVDHHRALAEIEYCGLDAVFGWPRVHNRIDAAVQVVEYVRGGGGADV